MTRRHSNERPLLILDLDETLIHSTDQLLEHPPSFIAKGLAVYERPHVRAFLDGVAPWFDVAIWSAAWFPYVEAVVTRLIGDRLDLAFLWGQDRCTLRRDLERDRFYHAKNLKKVKRRGWDLSRVLIVDDDPVKVSQSYGNAVYVKAFYGDPADNELARLLEYLLLIRDEPEYRRLEKRGWRGQLNRLRG